MNIKAILSDLDGTLIDFNGAYNNRVPSLIKQLQQKNIQFALATGKAFFGEVAHIIQELDLSPLNIVNGGAMIINWRTGDSPWLQPISQRSIKCISEYLDENKVAFSLETKNDAFQIRLISPPPYKNWITVKEYKRESLPLDVLKILVHAKTNRYSEDIIDRHVKHIKELSKDVAVIKFHLKEYFGLDVTSETSTKHTAVLEYGKILGIDPSEIVAIGDGYNDYPLFTACGYRIAMGNAPRELKEIAHKVVSTADQGGMSEALTHLSLL